MKKTLKIFIIVFLLCLFVYVCKIESIPNNIIIYKNDNINLGNFLGINYTIGNKNIDTILASSSIENELQKENNLQVKLFNIIHIKEPKKNNLDKYLKNI